MSEILTVADAAEITGFHANNLRIAIRRGQLRARRFGGWTYMITRSDFNDYIRSHPRPSRVAHVAIH